MKKARKVLTLVALVGMIISVALLIGAIFGLEVFEGALLKMLLSFATLAVGGAFAISALSIYNKNRNISIVAMSLLALSVLCGLIIFWTGFNTPVIFNKLIIILAMATILFNIIVSLIIKLDRRYLIIQIITYILVLIIDILLTLQVFNVNILSGGFLKIFIVLCLIAFAMLCTTGILGRKSDTGEESTTEKTSTKKVTLSKEEYDELLNKIKLLEEENKALKNQLEKI